jgi:predicted lipoprotein with Yx(FWY)xxD motif
MDGNGYISRISPEGDVIESRWIDGQQEAVTLNAPKGMALRNDTFFVADVNTVRLFDRTTGEPLGAWEVPGAAFLNDLSAGADVYLYGTDTGNGSAQTSTQQPKAGAVYRFRADGTPTVIAQGDDLNMPNGIVGTQDGPIVVTFGASEVYRINSEGERQVVAQLPEGQLDGVVRRDDGTLFVSSWSGEAIYHVSLDGTEEVRPVMENVSSPADIGYDASQNRLLIPQLREDRIQLVGMPQEAQRARWSPSQMTDSTEVDTMGRENPRSTLETKPENDRTAQVTRQGQVVTDDTTKADAHGTAAATIRIRVARHAELGPYLTDARGRAVYMFKADTSRSSTCYERCAEVWPPVLTQGAPRAADSTVQEELLGTIQRRDGQVQVTYNEWPFYYYAKDTEANQVKGQDMMGFGAEWSGIW